MNLTSGGVLYSTMHKVEFCLSRLTLWPVFLWQRCMYVCYKSAGHLTTALLGPMQICRRLYAKVMCSNRDVNQLTMIQKSEKLYVCNTTALRQVTSHFYVQAGQILGILSGLQPEPVDSDAATPPTQTGHRQDINLRRLAFTIDGMTHTILDAYIS